MKRKDILKKLAEAFCDFPYIQPCDWADTLAQLTELFYALKNETRDQLGDDTLIAAMAARFNGGAGGSLDALAETDPAWFLRFTGERSTHEPWPDPPVSRPFPGGRPAGPGSPVGAAAPPGPALRSRQLLPAFVDCGGPGRVHSADSGGRP